MEGKEEMNQNSVEHGSDSNLNITMATWVYMLHRSGYSPACSTVQAACRALDDADPRSADLDELGKALVEAIVGELGTATPSFKQVLQVVTDWFGPEHIASDLGKGEDREERTRAIRRYQFSNSRPWLALIIDRFPEGRVGEHWVMVEEVTDVVKVMDPYPWDDVDEQYEMPLPDFMVKWELAGIASIRFMP